MDEALAVGDGYFQKKSIDRITEFHRRGGTLLFCSHALYYVALLCDAAIWLKNGAVAAAGSGAAGRPRLRGVSPGEGARLARRRRDRGAGGLSRPTDGRRPARITEVFVHDGSGYPRTEFAAGETLAVDVAFETEDPSLAFHVAHRRRPRGRRPGLRVDTRREPWAPLTGRRRYRLRLVVSRAAGGPGRVSRLRLSRRREGAPRPRRADPEARLLGGLARVRRRPACAPRHLWSCRRRSRRRRRCRPPACVAGLVDARARVSRGAVAASTTGARLSRLRWRRAAGVRRTGRAGRLEAAPGGARGRRTSGWS